MQSLILLWCVNAIVFIIFAMLCYKIWKSYSYSESTTYEIHIPSFPIDAVVTWVDSTDSQWRTSKDYFLDGNTKAEAFNNVNRWNDEVHCELELSLCLRLIVRHMPYINHIYVVTARPQTPRCIDTLPANVSVIHHDEIFCEYKDHLPTFNSLAIETHIGNIPGLSEHFVYFNDDFLVTSPIPAFKLFDSLGRPFVYGNTAYTLLVQPVCLPGDPFICQRMRTNNKLNADKFVGGHVFNADHTFKCFTKSSYRNVIKRFWNDFEGTSRSKFRSPIDIDIQHAITNLMIRSGEYVWYTGKDHLTSLLIDNINHDVSDILKYDSVCINACNSQAAKCNLIYQELDKCFFLTEQSGEPMGN